MAPHLLIMKRRLLASALLSATLTVMAATSAFEIGPHNTAQLPRGKEADGIIGDFVLRNDYVEALVSGDLPMRRADMSTFYGDTGITPGCLYDLTLRGAHNDQLTIYCPSNQRGDVSYVRIVDSEGEGALAQAAVETVVNAANNGGLYKRHVYVLNDSLRGVLVRTTYRNESNTTASGSVEDFVKPYSTNSVFLDVRWYNAVDPADKCGYALGWLEGDGKPGSKLIKPLTLISLAPGQSTNFTRYLAVGKSPAEAVGEIFSWSHLGNTSLVRGTVRAKARGIATAEVTLRSGTAFMPAYPDAQGNFLLHLPAGKYAVDTADRGRASLHQELVVDGKNPAPLSVEMEPVAGVAFDIRDEKGRSLPCKVQFIGLAGTPTPQLGPQTRAHGCVDQWHSERGDFHVPLDPGMYKLIVTRGIEYSHLAQTLRVTPGEAAICKGVLKRLVDTRGWISADFHNHSTPSGDNHCGTDDRIINLAAEHIEFAPTTEHNRIYDWWPHIRRLGLTNEISTVIGLELTGSGAGSHFNSFPFKPTPFVQNNGAPVHQSDPRLNAINLRSWDDAPADRWIQINHPDVVEKFIDRDGDGRPDGGFTGLESLIDGIETQNYGASRILDAAPFRIARGRDGREQIFYNTEFIWLQMLNRGHRYWGVAVCDAHAVYGNGVGGWRMYIPSSTDAPDRIAWQEISRNAKAGRMILTTGPYLEVRTEDGTLAGGHARSNGGTTLHVRVQCTDWLDIDRVQVLVNGRAVPALNFTRETHPALFANGVVKFDQAIKVPLNADAHLIVVAYGSQSDLKIGYGTSAQSKNRPCAYNNPIFVDADGNGFQSNGDTLGWDLPVKKLSLAEARRLLQAQEARDEVKDPKP